jgi:cell division transport system permease protein
MSQTPAENELVPMEQEALSPWLKKAPLLPEADAAGTPLVIVIAVICFLASIALTGFFSVSQAAKAWTDDLKGSVTVQIKGPDAVTISANTQKALEFLRGTEGIISARALERAETEELLEPWLGSGNLPLNLPVPGLIAVEASANLRNNIESFSESLSLAAPGATISDHGVWNESLVASARTAQAFAFGIFLLVMGAVCTIIIFAARAGLAANREIVDVLHLVGATDQFIAKEVQRRFLILGLRGALAGVSVAILSVLLVVFIFGQHVTDSYFLPTLSTNSGLFLWLLIVPILTSGAAAWSARTTVLRTLQARF